MEEADAKRNQGSGKQTTAAGLWAPEAGGAELRSFSGCGKGCMPKVEWPEVGSSIDRENNRYSNQRKKKSNLISLGTFSQFSFRSIQLPFISLKEA